MSDHEGFIKSIEKQLLKANPHLSGAGDLKVRESRHQALNQALKLKPPTPRHPLWKYALLEPLLAYPPVIHYHRAKLASKKIFHENFLDIEPTTSLVFVNGFFTPSLSHIPKDSAITIKHFKEMMVSKDNLVDDLFEKSQKSLDFFHQLNVAMTNDGAFIIIPTQTIVKKPILIYHFLTDFGDRHYWVSPQTHIHIEKNASVNIVEKTISLATGQSCLNAQSFLTLFPGAHCDYMRIDKGNPQSFSFSHTKIVQYDSSHLNINLCSIGGMYHRIDVDTELLGKNAHYILNGLLLPNTTSHHDWVTKLHHLSSASTSSHQVRSIIADEGHASYIGNLSVNQSATKTIAIMQNHHVMLGKTGKANSSPQLEILCDDVICNHGATTGELDEKALFYLKSRGIEQDLAKAILLRSHISYFIDAIHHEKLKYILEKIITAQIYSLMNEGGG